MAIQLFKLRGVPDDEAEDIRTLLTENDIDFYETPAGNWGLSMPAIWVKTEPVKQAGEKLIDQYQEQRAISARAAYEALKQQGEQQTLVSSFRENPLQFLVYTAIVVTVLYFSIKPFIGFGQ